ncbi:MAG: D-glycero-beta-D-manno-heptose 1-phosphate adenylyltransferase [Nitrospirae bacterium]|nr:D-glycero-beta-D-manno-heptose 1-phosphate adenylyltransferase [Nitrospirota bacterium]
MSVEKPPIFTGTEGKILPHDRLLERVEQIHSTGQKVVFTNGCFDLVHAGHIEVLERARQAGDFLIVALNTDSSVRKLKGPSRPLVTEFRRARVIGALTCVDAVTFFDTPTPYELIKLLQPDVLVKGGDWKPEQIIGSDIVNLRGGIVLSIPLVPDSSTTLLVQTVLERYRNENPSGNSA